MNLKNILALLPILSAAGLAFAAKPLPYKISFLYDTRDNGTSFEGDCATGLFDVAEPGVGLAKRLVSNCLVKDRALTDGTPTFAGESFEADYDVSYVWPCAGQELGIGLSAQGKTDGVKTLRMQGVNRRGEFYAAEGNPKPLFLTVTGRSNLAMFDINPRNKSRILAECTLTIQSITLNPSINTLEKWIVQAEGSAMLIRSDIDGFRLAGAFLRLSDKPKELLQDQLLKIDRIILTLNDPADIKKKLAAAEAAKVKLAIQQAIDAPAGQVPDFGAAQKSADEVVKFFSDKLQASIASAVKQIDRFAAFTKATNVDKRPIDAMDMDAIREMVNPNTTLDMSVDAASEIFKELDNRKNTVVNSLKNLVSEGGTAVGNPPPATEPEPCSGLVAGPGCSPAPGLCQYKHKEDTAGGKAGQVNLFDGSAKQKSCDKNGDWKAACKDNNSKTDEVSCQDQIVTPPPANGMCQYKHKKDTQGGKKDQTNGLDGAGKAKSCDKNGDWKTVCKDGNSDTDEVACKDTVVTPPPMMCQYKHKKDTKGGKKDQTNGLDGAGKSKSCDKNGDWKTDCKDGNSDTDEVDCK